MQQAMVNQLPTVIERTYAGQDGVSLYKRFAGWLASRGFAVQQTEPPLVDPSRSSGQAPSEFRGGLRGERDVVLDAQRRALGKGLLISAALLTVVSLFVMVSGEDRYWVIDWLLTIDVVMGGVGLMLLRRPPDHQRTVVEVAIEGRGDSLRVEVREGVGQVEDGTIYKWVEGAEDAVGAEDIDALVTNAGPSEAYA
jgi:hypothetical protein